MSCPASDPLRGGGQHRPHRVTSRGGTGPPQSFGRPGFGAQRGLPLPGQVASGSPAPPRPRARRWSGPTVLDWDGNSWSAGALPWTPSVATRRDRRVPAAAIACPTITLCAIVSGDDHRGVDEPAAAVDPPPDASIPGAARLDLLPHRVVLHGRRRHGSVLLWNGGTWSAPAQVVPAPPSTPAIGTSVSCSERPLLHGHQRRRRLRHLRRIPGRAPRAPTEPHSRRLTPVATVSPTIPARAVDRAPVPGGGHGPEAALEEGVVELGRPVAPRAVEEDLGADHLEAVVAEPPAGSGSAASPASPAPAASGGLAEEGHVERRRVGPPGAT